jgi:hypothetical protein
MKGIHRKAKVAHLCFGALIAYDPAFVDADICVFIAHELGHIVNRHILECPDTQNMADVFRFLALNDRNEFYKHKAKDFIFPSEAAIIDAVSNACPIADYNQLPTV